jgi:hypothetical protein
MTKTTVVKLRITPEDKARWQTHADTEGQSLSEYVRIRVEVGQETIEETRKATAQLEAHRVKSLAK